MSKEVDNEKALQEAKLAQVRENFKNNGFDPELVKAISEFGDLWGIRTCFYLDKEKPKGYMSLNYRYSDGFLSIRLDDEHGFAAGFSGDGFKKIGIEETDDYWTTGPERCTNLGMKDNLYFEKDLGIHGTEVVWVTRNGEFFFGKRNILRK